MAAACLLWKLELAQLCHLVICFLLVFPIPILLYAVLLSHRCGSNDQRDTITRGWAYASLHDWWAE